MTHLDRYRGREAATRAYAIIELARRHGISAEAAANIYDRGEGKPELIETLIQRGPSQNAGRPEDAE